MSDVTAQDTSEGFVAPQQKENNANDGETEDVAAGVDPEELAKIRKKLANSLTELYTTEWEFVNDMHTLVSVYVNTLSPDPASCTAAAAARQLPNNKPAARGKNAFHRSAASTSGSAGRRARTKSGQKLLESCGFSVEPLTTSESRALFRDIEALICINETLLGDLQERFQTVGDKDRHLAQVGDILVQFAPHLKMYRHYFTAQDASDRLLTSLEASRPSVKKFLQWASRLPQCKNLNLQSFLIRPVQRIPQLSLLVNEIIRWNAVLSEPKFIQAQIIDSDPIFGNKRLLAERYETELTNCRAALAGIRGSASHIERGIEKWQNQAKVVRLERQFYPPQIFRQLDIGKIERSFVREGFITLIHHKKGRRQYWFVLFSDLLVWGKPVGKGIALYKMISQTVPIGFDEQYKLEDGVLVNKGDNVQQVTYVDGHNQMHTEQRKLRQADDSVVLLGDPESIHLSFRSDSDKLAWLADFDAVVKKRENRRRATVEAQRRSGRLPACNGDGPHVGSFGEGAATGGQSGTTTGMEPSVDAFSVVSPSAVWEPNSLSRACNVCNRVFGFLTRKRRHCRVCGRCVCTSCSKKRFLSIPGIRKPTGRNTDIGLNKGAVSVKTNNEYKRRSLQQQAHENSNANTSDSDFTADSGTHHGIPDPKKKKKKGLKGAWKSVRRGVGKMLRGNKPKNPPVMSSASTVSTTSSSTDTMTEFGKSSSTGNDDSQQLGDQVADSSVSPGYLLRICDSCREIHRHILLDEARRAAPAVLLTDTGGGSDAKPPPPLPDRDYEAPALPPRDADDEEESDDASDTADDTDDEEDEEVDRQRHHQELEQQQQRLRQKELLNHHNAASFRRKIVAVSASSSRRLLRTNRSDDAVAVQSSAVGKTETQPESGKQQRDSTDSPPETATDTEVTPILQDSATHEQASGVLVVVAEAAGPEGRPSGQEQNEDEAEEPTPDDIIAPAEEDAALAVVEAEADRAALEAELAVEQQHRAQVQHRQRLQQQSRRHLRKQIETEAPIAANKGSEGSSVTSTTAGGQTVPPFPDSEPTDADRNTVADDEVVLRLQQLGFPHPLEAAKQKAAISHYSSSRRNLRSWMGEDQDYSSIVAGIRDTPVLLAYAIAYATVNHDMHVAGVPFVAGPQPSPAFGDGVVEEAFAIPASSNVHRDAETDELFTSMLCVSYQPDHFARIRKVSGISSDSWLRMLGTCLVGLSADSASSNGSSSNNTGHQGASSAVSEHAGDSGDTSILSFRSQSAELIVTSVSPNVVQTVLNAVQHYADHLESHPDSLLDRYMTVLKVDLPAPLGSQYVVVKLNRLCFPATLHLRRTRGGKVGAVATLTVTTIDSQHYRLNPNEKKTKKSGDSNKRKQHHNPYSGAAHIAAQRQQQQRMDTLGSRRHLGPMKTQKAFALEHRGLRVGAGTCSSLMRRLEHDVAYLRDHQFVDYSLVVGVTNLALGRGRNAAPLESEFFSASEPDYLDNFAFDSGVDAFVAESAVQGVTEYGGSGGGLVQSVQLYLSNVFTQHGRSFSATTAFYVKAALEAASSSEDYGKSDQRTDVLQPVGVSTAAGSQAASAIPIGASSFATRFLGFVEENLFT